MQGEGKTQSIMKNNAMTRQDVGKTPQVFTDEELSEIFQINFAEIFGSPAEKPKSDYKGINLPKKDNLGQQKSALIVCPLVWLGLLWPQSHLTTGHLTADVWPQDNKPQGTFDRGEG